MGNIESIKSTIEKYVDYKNIEPHDLYIDMQLEFDHEEDEYVIEYGVKDASILEEDGLVPKLRYDTLEEAWNEYLEQFPEIHQSFPEARKLLTHPREYEATQLGGNPIERILDTRINN